MCRASYSAAIPSEDYEERTRVFMQAEVRLSNTILAIAKKLAAQGPGFSQQSAVLEEVKRVVPNSSDLNVQQKILRTWHSLFIDGHLSWGYDLSNPDSPFYHVTR